MVIKHKGETKGNKLRHRMTKAVGCGLQTYTPSQMAVAKARGCYLWTVDGKKLSDWTSGVLVANLGYAHRRFETLCRKYGKDMPHNAYNMVAEVQVRASERLIKSMKTPKMEQVLWAASGSEGIQKAMWAAMHRYPERPILAATRAGFHGKKGLADDVTGESSTNPNVRFISFPMDDDLPLAHYEAELDALWEKHADEIALLITEPYLGAAGSFHPPLWYHQMLESWCNAHDIPLIFDEVQACFGRTGNMYAFESYKIEPDLVVLGKGMANGIPASAVVGRADLISALAYGAASDTFSGNPDACAATCATLDVFREEKVVKHCRKMAKKMRRILDALADEFAFIKAIRGEGLVYGIEMADGDTANRCVLEAYHGTGKKGVHFLGPLAGKVLRVSPPLVVTAKELHEAHTILRRAWARI